jgi:hypothetical protein|tara:strand:- start:811 stop:1098 length:288 start_codon:yes stop_codon:yes gene_type:complete
MVNLVKEKAVKVEAKTVPFPSMVIGVKDKAAATKLLATKVRPGTLRMRRWNILVGMDGKTVSEYFKACKEDGVPCTANNPRDAAKFEIVTLTAPK